MSEMDKTINFHVHDVIETPGFAHPRLYSVVGIYLGATRQEDCVELECIDRSKPCEGDTAQKTMHVPHEMLIAGISAGVFQLTRDDA